MFKAWLAQTDPVNLEPFDGDLKGVDGWLARDGSFYQCIYVFHSIFADKLCKKFRYKVLGSFPSSKNGEYTLEQKGWVKISNNKVFYYNKKPMSKKQLDFLFDYFMANEQEMDNYQKILQEQSGNV